MACIYKYNGKTYDRDDFTKVLLGMKPSEASKYMSNVSSVPDAPFITKTKNYSMLAIKRAVRMAAEGGFDKLGWTPGEIQAARYDLSKQVDKIEYAKFSDGTYYLEVYTKTQGTIGENKTEKELADFVGKEMAEKIITSAETGKTKSVSGGDLKVGGEGMKSFYDKMLVNEVNKFFNKKKWGKAKVGVGKIPSIQGNNQEFMDGFEEYVEAQTGFIPSELDYDERNKLLKAYEKEFADEAVEIWTLPITPEIKQKALREGMPMFMVKDQGGPRTEKQVKVSAKKKKLSPVAREYLEMLIAVQPAVATKKDMAGNPFEGLRKEVAEKMEASKGLGKKSLAKKILGSPKTAWQLFTRSFKDIDAKEMGGVSNILRLHKEVKTSSQRRATTLIEQVVVGLKPKQYDTFRLYLIMGDMLKDIESGLIDPAKGLPFGFNSAKEARDFYNKVELLANEDSAVKNALERRTRMNNQLRGILVKAGLLPESVLKDDRYFHHQVLEYRAVKDIGNEWTLSHGTGSGVLAMRKKGWQKARIGSIKEYNTDYIQAEYEVVAQAFAQLETMNTLARLKKTADMTESLKLTAEARGIKDWKSIISEIPGAVEWAPAPGSAWFRATSITDRLMQQVQSGEITDPEITKNVWARGKDAMWVIPQELAVTLDNFGKADISNDEISKASRAMMNAWKKWILINPFRIVKYNLNNMSGDFDIAWAYDPKIVSKYFNKAAKDLWAERKGKPLSKELKAEIDMAYRQGVIGSGWSMQDISGLAEELLFNKRMEALTDSKPGFVKKAWRWSADITSYRENILRLAAYRYFKERIANGEEGMYAASNKEEVDAITDSTERAAKLSRDLIGDYGNISEGGQWMRRHLIPFFSWLEVNAPRYVRLIKNLKHEGQGSKKGAARLTGVMATKVAWKGTKLAIKATTLMAAVMLFNRLVHPDEEKDLSETQRRQLHLIIKRRADGTIMTIRFQGALSDALAWFGGEDIVHDVKDVVSGKETLGTKAKEAALAAPVKLFHGVRPDVKLLFELPFGKSLYPDPFFPRPIRDKWEHVARTFSLNSIQNFLARKPKRGGTVGGQLLSDLISLGFYTADPGESAFWDTKKKTFDYLRKLDVERSSVTPTDKANAMYYYKRALKYGDLSAAERYLKAYIDLKGTRRGMKLSIKTSGPLGALSAKNRRKFLKTLTEGEKDTLEVAKRWYKETYKNPKNTIPWPTEYYLKQKRR